MKKIKYFTLTILIMMLVLVLASCGGSTLGTPDNMDVDINNKLSWTPVENAKSYVIHIKGKNNDYDNEVYSRKSSYSLNKLDVGVYEIVVKAIPIEDGAPESDWSETFVFDKKYENGCVYKLINNNTEFEIVSAGSATGDIIIEDEYRGLRVTSIAEYAFKGAGRLTSIKVGGYVKSIGLGAFYACSGLTSITLPESLETIGKAAFQNCRSLVTLTIPSKVTKIDEETFIYCKKLESINLPDGITEIGLNAFANCDSLKSFTLPAETVKLGDMCFTKNTSLKAFTFNKKLETIPTSLFLGDEALETVVFPEGSALKEIGETAFYGCTALNNVTLREGLETIGVGAFFGATALETVNIPTTVKKVGLSAFLKTKLYTNSIANKELFLYLDNWILYYNESVEKITRLDKNNLKANTYGIADNVFAQADTLTRVDLPKSVKYVGASSFASCDKLYRFTMVENGLIELGDGALAGNPLLQTLSLKDGLKTIGNNCFYGCTILNNNELQESLIPSTVTRIGYDAFYDTALFKSPDSQGLIYAGEWLVGVDENTLLASVTIKDGTVGICDYLFYRMPIRNVEGLYNVKYLGKGCFYMCSELQSIVLNKNLKEIPDFSFYGCSNLFNVSFPQNLTYLGQFAFGKCDRLDTVDLTKTRITEIKDGTFYKDGNLTSVKFNNLITSIGENAFYKCRSLEAIEIPESVETLGAIAFYGCSNLKSVKFNSKITRIEHHTFGLCGLEAVTIPSNIKYIGESAFRSNEALTSITFEEGVEVIDFSAFYGATSLESLVLPNSVKELGKLSFARASKLKEVILKDSIETIGEHAFYRDINLTIFATGDIINPKWSQIYNSSYRPVVYGTKLDSTQTYVESIVVQSTVGDCGEIKVDANAPTREGYVFKGYKQVIIDEEGNEKQVIYEAKDIINLPAGTVLTVVWELIQA